MPYLCIALSAAADAHCCLVMCCCSWKTIVVNTPRTLQEILPALMAEVINALADPSKCCTWVYSMVLRLGYCVAGFGS